MRLKELEHGRRVYWWTPKCPDLHTGTLAKRGYKPGDYCIVLDSGNTALHFPPLTRLYYDEAKALKALEQITADHIRRFEEGYARIIARLELIGR